MKAPQDPRQTSHVFFPPGSIKTLDAYDRSNWIFESTVNNNQKQEQRSIQQNLSKENLRFHGFHLIQI